MKLCIWKWDYMYLFYTKIANSSFLTTYFMWVKICPVFIQCKANKTERRNGNSPNSHCRNLWHTHLEITPVFRFILYLDNLALVWNWDWKLRTVYSCMSQRVWIKWCLSATLFDTDDSDSSLFEAQNGAFWKLSLILS